MGYMTKSQVMNVGMGQLEKRKKGHGVGGKGGRVWERATGINYIHV